MNGPSVLVIGEPDSFVGQLVKTFFESIKQPFALEQTGVLPELLGQQERLALCDLVIVLLQHPDEVAVDDVLTLFLAAPLARVLVITGTWCDGLLRNRSGWPPGIVVRAEVAAERLSKEWSTLQASSTLKSRPLKPTADRDEVFAESVITVRPFSMNREVGVQIDTPDFAYATILRENCLACGLSVETGQIADQLDKPRKTWLLFDLDPWPERQEAWASWANCRQLTRIIALAGWPQLITVPQTDPNGPYLDVFSKLEPIAMVLQRLALSSSPASGEHPFPVC